MNSNSSVPLARVWCATWKCSFFFFHSTYLSSYLKCPEDISFFFFCFLFCNHVKQQQQKKSHWYGLENVFFFSGFSFSFFFFFFCLSDLSFCFPLFVRCFSFMLCRECVARGPFCAHLRIRRGFIRCTAAFLCVRGLFYCVAAMDHTQYKLLCTNSRLATCTCPGNGPSPHLLSLYWNKSSKEKEKSVTLMIVCNSWH